MKQIAIAPIAALAVMLSTVACVLAEDAKSAEDANQRAEQLVDRGLAFLKSKQLPDGGWNKDPEPPAITALALRGFVRAPQRDQALIDKGVQRLLSYQKPDGGIYADINANYNTAIAISFLTSLKDPKLQPNIDRAIAFLKGLQ